MGDVEVPSDVARHPGVVSPEELEPGGGLDYGGSSVRGGDGDIDPASAVGGVYISLLKELLVRYVLFAVDISLREVTPVKLRIIVLPVFCKFVADLLQIL